MFLSHCFCTALIHFNGAWAWELPGGLSPPCLFSFWLLGLFSASLVWAGQVSKCVFGGIKSTAASFHWEHKGQLSQLSQDSVWERKMLLTQSTLYCEHASCHSTMQANSETTIICSVIMAILITELSTPASISHSNTKNKLADESASTLELNVVA